MPALWERPDCLRAVSWHPVPTACPGGSERPCSGNGRCSGDGSRQGDGSCQCHPGYRGALCTDCVDGYFSALRNETHSVCTGTAARRWGRPASLLPGVQGQGREGQAEIPLVTLPLPDQPPGRSVTLLLTPRGQLGWQFCDIHVAGRAPGVFWCSACPLRPPAGLPARGPCRVSLVMWVEGGVPAVTQVEPSPCH